ncbi:MAG: UvrD-helicase domain-containing protein [Lachnospiraceae bacterium]
MYIADLHIHSRFSRATSRDGDPEHLDLWARRKGIHIVGTGDFTHPAWRKELKEKLTLAEDGLYVLKEEYRIRDGMTPDSITPRFVLTGEISSIYKKNGRVRKVHNLILLPDMETAQQAAKRLEVIGNIHSDGRPILGLDCRDLLELLLDTSPDIILVPAHIWTPHFSVFGAFSGFDTMEECFEDLTPHIHAVETGLSSDPPMNWRVSALDSYHLISNSDAHSPAKLGREANLLEIPMSYAGIQGAIQEGKGLYGTIKLFQPWEVSELEGQMDLFSLLGGMPKENAEPFKMEEETAAAPEDGGDPAAAKESQADSPMGETWNAEQKKAVCAKSRRTAVVAGPGTGKTKTLTSHAAYLMEHRKVKASEITAVTFTNQAAGEMRKRMEELLGNRRQRKQMQIGTFHALCLSFLREQGEEVCLIDEREARELARSVTAEHGLKWKPDQFLAWVSREKSQEKSRENSPEELEKGVGVIPEADPEENFEGLSSKMVRMDEKSEGKEERERLDAAFLAYQAKLKERNRMDFDDLLLETLERMERAENAEWKKRYSYLLVDEFQDINPIQYRLMKAWNEGGRELFVIGDPDQSIYGFRGSDAACFAKLSEDYPDLEIIELRENYRSSAPILKAALAVISENPGKERKLNAAKSEEEPAPVRIVQAGSDKGAAIFAAKEINRLTGGIGMLEAHETAAHATGRRVWGFGDIAVLYRTHRQAELLETCLGQEGIPYVVAGRESYLEADSVQGTLYFFQYLMNETDAFAKGQAEKLIWNLEDNPLAEEIIRMTAETFRPLVQKKKPQAVLERWMTLHGSKGLEFPVTIIHGVQKGMIPLEHAKYATDEEEERRLLYVGMTRAKEELILTAAGEESLFLSVLKEPDIVREEAGKKKKTETYHQMSLFD